MYYFTDAFATQNSDFDNVNLTQITDYPSMRGASVIDVDAIPLSDEPDELLKLNVLAEDAHASPSDASSVSSPVLSPTGVHTPNEFHDVNTQMSLCERSARLHLQDENTFLGGADATNASFFSMVSNHGNVEGEQESTSRKVRKSQRNSDAATASHTDTLETLETKPVTSSPFVFEKFGKEAAAALYNSLPPGSDNAPIM